MPVAGDTCMQCHKGEVRNWVIKNLIDTLVSQGRVSFNDIIEGKGSGACILLGGPPDTSKTLTAEIFAESTERPLLSVQAAQLGVNPDTVEKELNLVLQRGARFNAVILLDEADVYIRERGINLEQNAIVAAFLRTLETHNATLFLTTNRTNNVDDAIASRCLARIDYDMPTNDEQKPIWKILNDINQTGLSDHDIDTIVERHHQFSGRDIKQILKLASLWSSSKQNIRHHREHRLRSRLHPNSTLPKQKPPSPKRNEITTISNPPSTPDHRPSNFPHRSPFTPKSPKRVLIFSWNELSHVYAYLPTFSITTLTLSKNSKSPKRAVLTDFRQPGFEHK